MSVSRDTKYIQGTFRTWIKNSDKPQLYEELKNGAVLRTRVLRIIDNIKIGLISCLPDN